MRPTHNLTIPIGGLLSISSVFNNSHGRTTAAPIADARIRRLPKSYQAAACRAGGEVGGGKRKKDDGQADNLRRDILDFKATNHAKPTLSHVLMTRQPAAQHVFLRGNARQAR